MKVLFTTLPMISHVHSLATLGKALCERGHDVKVATAASLRGQIEKAGLKHYACGIDHDGIAPFGVSIMKYVSENETRSPGKWLVAEVAAPQMMEGLQNLLQGWEPDVVVRMPGELAGHLLARKLRIPDVGFVYSLILSKAEMIQEFRAGLTILEEELGLQPDPELDMIEKSPHVCFAPKSWFPNPGDNLRFFHCPRYGGIEGVASSDIEKINRPYDITVISTFGTNAPNRAETHQAVIDAAATLPVNLVVTSGTGVDPSLLKPAKNTTVIPYLPHSEILPVCDIAITHGGYGTMLACLEFGLPSIVVPLGTFDAQQNGKRLEELQAGVMIDEPGILSTDSAKNALEKILESPVYRDGAKRLGTELCQQPPISEACSYLSELTRA